MQFKKIMDNLLKRHKTQEQALLELETKTAELFKQNVKNNIKQAKQIEKLTSDTSIKTETLESAWKTIATGIDEKKKLEDKSSKKRKNNKFRLEAIKKDFNKKYPVPKKK
ncbi:MAG: toxic anion resistance protein [Oscillospiraceae bacterium]|nr:toxic anion resistance protein [Oscillospiraceae bacterium]